MAEKVENSILKNDASMVTKVNQKVVLKAVNKMKHNKADVSGGFTSTAIKWGPNILFNKLAEIFRMISISY